MMTKILEKKNIRDLLTVLVQEYDTYVPLRNFVGDVFFEALPREEEQLKEALNNVALDDANTLISPKDIFFPQLECLFEFKDGRILETVESSPKLLFGVKACDVSGIFFCDDFFKRNFVDRYYESRIENRFIVVIGCMKPPRSTCFCTSTGTGPFLEKDFDLQFIDNKDSYFVETGSARGGEFIDRFSKYFKDSSKDYVKTISTLKSNAAESIELKVDFRKALERMSSDDFSQEEIYKEIGEKCIYCGGCLYVCPTCTCFTVCDHMKDNEGERDRIWDACVFEGYSREASGHNPRKEKWQRTSRRYEHKLKYDYKVTGMSGCVGCGRCLSSCPVNVGMSKFIQEITKL